MNPTSVMNNPLGTEKIGTLLRRFSIPAIISMLVSALYNMVDQIFIGNFIDMLGVAATSVALPITTISTALALLFSVGGSAGFNLRLGAGKADEAAHYAGNAISCLAISGAVFGAITMTFYRPMLLFFGSSENILVLAEPYTRIIAAGIPFLVFSTGVSNLIRADGSPKYAMAVVLSGAVFNLIFDPIFLFVFNMGIEGIAWATTLGQVLSSVIALVYLLKRFRSVSLTKSNLRPRLKYFGSISSLGAAAFLNQIAITLVQIVLNNTLRHYGELSPYGSDIPLTAVGAIAKVNMFFLAIVIGIAQGCQPIVSFNYGAKNYSRVKETYKKGAGIATIVSVIAFLIFQLFPYQVAGIFGDGSELYFSFAVRYLRIFMFMTFVNGIQPVTSNFFTSIGKAKLGALLSLTRQVLFLIPLVLILPLFFGIDGVVFAGPIADAIAFLLAAFLIIREMRRMPKQDGLPAK